MQIINFLPKLAEALGKWKEPPTEEEFRRDYYDHVEAVLRPMIEDFSARFGGSLYEVVQGLNWKEYRAEALLLNAAREERRVSRHIASVETLLGVKLEGEVVLFGAFTAMDGYARFHCGDHRVYLGVDESHGRGAYLDILVTHELAHVAREAVECVWTGFGLDPKMTHDDFVVSLPVVEHLMSEGYSCVVSEILNPGEDPWNYVYQSQDSITQILEHGPAIDRVVHGEIKKRQGNYGSLYDTRKYKPELPRYCHYTWAWQWVKRLLRTRAGGDPRKLLRLCAKELIDDALSFKLQTIE